MLFDRNIFLKEKSLIFHVHLVNSYRLRTTAFHHVAHCCSGWLQYQRSTESFLILILHQNSFANENVIPRYLHLSSRYRRYSLGLVISPPNHDVFLLPPRMICKGGIEPCKRE